MTQSTTPVSLFPLVSYTRLVNTQLRSPAQPPDLVLVLAVEGVFLQFRFLPNREGPEVRRYRTGDECANAAGPDR